MKKILCCLLAAAMMLSCLTAVAFAKEEPEIMTVTTVVSPVIATFGADASTQEYYRAQLNHDEGVIYDTILSTIRNGQLSAELTGFTTLVCSKEVPWTTQYAVEKEINEMAEACAEQYGIFSQNASDAFSLDHPEYVFCFSGMTTQLSVGYSMENNCVNATVNLTLQLSTPSNFDEIYEAALDTIKNIGATGTTEEKIRTIHDYLCRTIVYTFSGNAHNLYGALLEGQSVCQGYATAFKWACDYYDIPCICVTGLGCTTTGSEAHMWNDVKLNGAWYGVDVTWDDQTSIMSDFYLVGSETVDENFGRIAFSASHLEDGLQTSKSTRCFTYPTLSKNAYGVNAGGPIILTEPVDYEGAAGETAAFTVVADGEDLQYQWQVCTNGSTWKDVTTSGYNKATLKVGVTAARNGYQYRCIIWDGNGDSVTSDAATLTKTPDKLAIVTQPADYAGALNTNAVLTVKATGEGLKYQWQVCTNGSTWKNVTGTGYNKASMTVTLTSARNGYQYRCVVTDGSGASVTSKAATLKKSAAALTITAQPENYTGDLNTSATFTVKATGEGLKYQWQVCINGSTWKNVTSTGYNKASMTVTLTSARNGYQYRCVVKDAYGASVTSKAATLKKGAAALTITAQPENYTGDLNTSATFTVKATGEGLKYQWQVCTNGSTWKNVTSTGYNKASLNVTLTSARNGYQYRCVVTDGSGASVTSAAASLAKK